MKKLFEGVFEEGNNIYTKNLVPGKRVYGERIIEKDGMEFREWNPFRSKYCAAIKKGLKESIFKEKVRVLYLGSAEGSTVSHVSDIVGKKGFVFCVDISEDAMEKLMDLSEDRENLFPIIADAQIPADYTEEVGGEIDALFQDVSQRNQAEIFLRNIFFLKKGGLGALTIKTKSISQSEPGEKVLEKVKARLREEVEIIQELSLEPFEKEHYLVLVRKK